MSETPAVATLDEAGSLGRLRVVDLQPSDVIVVELAVPISDAAVVLMEERLRCAFGADRRIVVYDPSVRLMVMRDKGTAAPCE